MGLVRGAPPLCLGSGITSSRGIAAEGPAGARSTSPPAPWGRREHVAAPASSARTRPRMAGTGEGLRGRAGSGAPAGWRRSCAGVGCCGLILDCLFSPRPAIVAQSAPSSRSAARAWFGAELPHLLPSRGRSDFCAVRPWLLRTGGVLTTRFVTCSDEAVVKLDCVVSFAGQSSEMRISG